MNASCRACLSQQVHLYTNKETEKNEILSGLLNTFTALTGFETHPIFLGGVFNLCEPCEAKLKLCNEFREMCLQSYTQLGQQFLKVEVNNDEEITLENFNVLSKEELSDSVVNDEIETVENFDSNHEDQVATISSNKRTQGDLQNDCKICNKSFNNPEDLDNHDCEVVNPNDVSENSLVETIFRDPVINEEIKMVEIFDTKIVKHEDIVSTVTNNKRPEKNSIEIALKGGKKFSCDKCDRSYTTKSNLNEHYKSHIIQSYACQFCPNTYKLERSLRRHLLAHSHQVECETCKKKFDNQEDLENHDCINEVINPNEVSENSLVEIEAVFNEEIEMKEIFDSKIANHEDKVSMITNNQDSDTNSKESALKGGKKFSCNKCDKSFTRKGNLKEHYKSHTISSYTCQFCPNTYKLESSLRRHLIAHTHPVECETCKKKFENEEDLENHDCTIRPKKFSCDKCDKSYITKSIEIYRRIPSASHKHFLQSYAGSARESRKRCKECYKNLSKKKGREYATNKTRKVKTYCGQCKGQPALCLKCFNKLHEKQ